MKLRTLSVFLLICHISISGYGQETRGSKEFGGEGAVLPLDQVLGQVLEQNPSIQAARSRWEAQKQRPKIAGTLPYPKLTYGHFFKNVETRVGAMQQKVGISQRFPFPGKLSLAAKKARQQARVVMWELQSMTQRLIKKTKVAYYDLHRVEQSQELLRSEIELLDSMIGIAQARYEAGEVPQQDVLKAQLAKTGLEDRLLDLDEQREAAVARLNALRDVSQDKAVRTTKDLQLPSLPEKEKAFAMANQYREELQAAGVKIARNRSALKLAKKQKWPDITVGLDYTEINENPLANPPDNGKDAFMGFISIKLPLWFNKWKAQEREARKRLEASREARSNLRNNVYSEVREIWFRVETNQDQVRLFRNTLVPQANQTFEASRAGYEGGDVSFIDLLDSERSLLNYRIGLVMSKADLAKSIARLERAMGLEIKDMPKREKQ